MKSTDVDKMINVVQTLRVCKPYVAPRLQRLSPVVAKGLLSRYADTSDSKVQQMIECVDQLHGAKGS
jgi:hypothetical protein